MKLIFVLIPCLNVFVRWWGCWLNDFKDQQGPLYQSPWVQYETASEQQGKGIHTQTHAQMGVLETLFLLVSGQVSGFIECVGLGGVIGLV